MAPDHETHLIVLLGRVTSVDKWAICSVTAPRTLTNQPTLFLLIIHRYLDLLTQPLLIFRLPPPHHLILSHLWQGLWTLSQLHSSLIRVRQFPSFGMMFSHHHYNHKY